MSNDYPLIGDMSFQEWKTLVDSREDMYGSGSTKVSFQEVTNRLPEKVIAWYYELMKGGNKPLLEEYRVFFNLKIERI